MINNHKELLQAFERYQLLHEKILEIGHNCSHESLKAFLDDVNNPVEESHQLLLEIQRFFERYVERILQEPPVDLEFRESDNDLVRAAKDLLGYGGHKYDCDQYLDDTPHEKDQQCCSCGWCLASDNAQLSIKLYSKGQP